MRMRKHDVIFDEETMMISVPFPTDMHGNQLTPRDIVAFTDGCGNDRQHAIEGFFLVLDDDASTDWDVVGHAHWQLDLGGMVTVPADETLLVPTDTE